jgi:hypothetical protein
MLMSSMPSIARFRKREDEGLTKRARRDLLQERRQRVTRMNSTGYHVAPQDREMLLATFIRDRRRAFVKEALVPLYLRRGGTPRRRVSVEAVRKSLFENDDRELLEAVVNKKPRTPPFLLFTKLAGVAEMVALVEAGVRLQEERRLQRRVSGGGRGGGGGKEMVGLGEAEMVALMEAEKETRRLREMRLSGSGPGGGDGGGDG